MNRVRLLPRLNQLGVSRILSLAKDKAPTSAGALTIIEEHASVVSFAASGGSVSYEASGQISQLIKDVAERHGFPEAGNVSVMRSEFPAYSLLPPPGNSRPTT